MFSLVSELHAHAGPVRSMALGPVGELISGCQADAPEIRRFVLSGGGSSAGVSGSSSSSSSSPEVPDLIAMGESILHDHWVTAVTSLKPGVNENYPQGLIITGCMDSIVRVYDPNTLAILLKLEGHEKGIISFSWTPKNKLISGSWDGCAKIWDLDLGGACMMELTGHENGVNVMSLSVSHSDPNIDGVLLTTSTGESVDSKPANFQVRVWDPVSGKQLGESLSPHQGPIRSLCPVPSLGPGGFATSSNDGSVKVYNYNMSANSLGDSSSVLQQTTMYHPISSDNMMPFVLDCAALQPPAGSSASTELVSCAEDGGVQVWNYATGESIQSIPHPTCCWCVLPLPSGDFLTGGHDGVIRWFSKNENLTKTSLSIALTDQLAQQVQAAADAQRKGPTDEELSKCTPWEDRANQTPSEGTVMVFNKEGKMIAAQMTSGMWAEIGEVTGKGNGDGGEINGVTYDHVMPVEMEAPGGGAMKLTLGFNDNENPFIAAQRFVDQNELGQQFTAQVADWIMQRTGRQDTPTIDMQGGGGGVVGDPTKTNGNGLPVPPVTALSFSFGLSGYIAFSDIPPQGKLFSKVQEFNEACYKMSAQELSHLQDLLQVLAQTSTYHVSTVDKRGLDVLLRLCSGGSIANDKLFPLFDIARISALHPHAASSLSVNTNLAAVWQSLLVMLTDSSIPAPTSLTGIRFLVNAFKTSELRGALLGKRDASSALLALISVGHANARSSNKSVRSAVASLTCNLAVVLFSEPEYKSLLYNTQILPKFLSLCNDQLSQEQEVLDNIFKVLSALGTIAHRGEKILIDKIKAGTNEADGVEIETILAIVRSAWAGRMTPNVEACVKEISVLLG